MLLNAFFYKELYHNFVVTSSEQSEDRYTAVLGKFWCGYVGESKATEHSEVSLYELSKAGQNRCILMLLSVTRDFLIIFYAQSSN